MPIKTHPVNSSNIARAGYDPNTLTLEVHFRNGSTYEYNGVPKSFYEGIFTSESPGAFFRKYVIKGRYKFKKMK